MQIQRDTLNQLRDFGLNSYESKLWTALLSKGSATAGELSEIASVPRSRTYDVLESLEKKGFLLMKVGKPITYLAVDPIHVLDRVKKKILNDAEIHTKIISKIEDSELFTDLKLLHKSTIKRINPSDLSGIFKSKKDVQHYLERRIKTAKKSIIIQTTDTGLIKERDLLNSIRKAKDNGVKVYIAAPITKDNSDAAAELGKFAEIRSTETNGRFYIIDGEETLFMLVNDVDIHKSYDSAIWVKSPFFSASLKKMFMTSWSSMKKIQTS